MHLRVRDVIAHLVRILDVGGQLLAIRQLDHDRFDQISGLLQAVGFLISFQRGLEQLPSELWGHTFVLWFCGLSVDGNQEALRGILPSSACSKRSRSMSRMPLRRPGRMISR